MTIGVLAGVLAGLFAAAFFAATLLPGSSEVALAAVLASEKVNAGLAIGIATIGNTLGSCVNWGIGRYAMHFQGRKWFPATNVQIERYSNWYGKWGIWTLLASWVPIIGDPLTLIAGMARTPIVMFIAVVAVAKLLRYLAVAGLLQLAL